MDKFISQYPVPSHNVQDGLIELTDELILIFCPTYGDGEIEEHMEDFLIGLNVRNKKFVVCELGNYYGYDDYEFGAAKTIIGHLKSLDWQMIYPVLSLDSMPIIDWSAYNAWVEGLWTKL